MTTPAEIRAYYERADKDALQLGSMLVAYRKTTGTTQQGLSRETGIAISILHHYESLLKLPPDLQARVKMAPKRGAVPSEKNWLNFKEARALTVLPSHDLMRKHATPFLERELSSTDVEHYIQLAKKHPDFAPERLVDMLQHPERYIDIPKTAERGSPAKIVPMPERYDTVLPAHIRQAATNMRALLQMCRWNQTVDALLARQALERLRDDVTAALAAERAAVPV